MWQVEVLYKYPKQYLLSDSPRKKMGPHEERAKISDPGGMWNNDLRIRSPLLYQLSYKARWELVVEN